MKITRGMEQLSYEEILRQFVLSSLEKKRLLCDIIAIFQYLGAYNKDGNGIFTMVCRDRTGDNGYKMKGEDCWDEETLMGLTEELVDVPENRDFMKRTEVVQDRIRTEVIQILDECCCRKGCGGKKTPGQIRYVVQEV
ncbi:hypothetical protein BTVI_18682 [Pitangus sulphuratus]|nr:hypothetical protein BTVI_18682 [Pitangus sulphuratus]